MPIGAPIANTQVYVVDGWLEPQPVGVAGELLIGGVQVARGYVGRAALTAERFVADPFSGVAGARLYRTGDLARWRADGTVEFLGRADQQVKIRGMRVELEEIEAALGSLPGIAQGAVALRGAGDLVAYLVPAGLDGGGQRGGGAGRRCRPGGGAGGAEAGAARAHGAVVVCRAAAAAADGVGQARPPGAAWRWAGEVAVAGYAAPRDEIETLCCGLVREVVSHDRLELGPVGIDDHFFDLGGHSILAAHYAARLEQALGRAVPVRLVFEAPTVRALAARLADQAGEEDALPAVTAADRSRPLPASLEQERMWLLNALHGAAPVYNEGLPLLLRGPLDTAALVRTVQDLLDRYEAPRTRLVADGAGLWQRIDPPGALRVVFEDWSEEDEAAGVLLARAAARATALLAGRYDLVRDYPCRALVIRLSAEAHLWCLATHHIVGDNWSLSHVMPADFFALYRAHASGVAPALPAIGLHVAHDAARGARAMRRGYWREQLQGAPAALDLPSDRRVRRCAARPGRG